MPKVDAYDSLVVPMRPAFQQGIDVRASPSAFGADIGAGLQDVGQGVGHLGKVLEALQAKEDDTSAKKALIGRTKATQDLLYGDNGYMYSQAGDAVAKRKAAAKALSDTTKKFGEGLSPSAKKIYDMAAQTDELGDNLSVIKHAGTERIQDFNQTTKAYIDTQKEAAISGYKDERVRGDAMKKGLAELDKMASENGWSPEVKDNMRKTFTSDTQKAVIGRMIEDDPTAAREYYLKHKDELVGTDQQSVEKVLKTGLEDTQAQQAANNWYKKGGTQDGTGLGPDDTIGDTNDGGGGGGGGSGIHHYAAVRRLILGKEGWTPGKYDTDAKGNRDKWRVGYSSDTITEANGTSRDARPGDTVDRAGAERDLNRRLKKQENEIVAKVGRDKYEALSPGAVAAVQSVTWNYGTTPFKVLNAIAMGGGDKAVAAAIDSLAGNDMNTKRRHEEAAIANGGPLPAARANDGGGAGTFEQREQYVQSLPPEIQDKTRARLMQLENARAKDEEASTTAAKQSMWDTVLRTGSIADVSVAIKSQAGEAAVSALNDYLAKGGKITSDAKTLYEMRLEAAADPEGFSKKNMNDYRNVLDDTDIKEMTGYQQAFAKDKVKAKNDAVVLTTAYDLADNQLRAAGLKGVAKNDDPAAVQAEQKKIVEFQNALTDQILEFKKLNQRNPDQIETQGLINRLMTPIIIKTDEPGSLFGDLWHNKTETPGFAFQASRLPLGSNVQVDMKITDIGGLMRTKIREDLAVQLKKPPSQVTDDEVVAYYVAFKLGWKK